MSKRDARQIDPHLYSKIIRATADNKIKWKTFRGFRNGDIVREGYYCRIGFFGRRIILDVGWHFKEMLIGIDFWGKCYCTLPDDTLYALVRGSVARDEHRKTIKPYSRAYRYFERATRPEVKK